LTDQISLFSDGDVQSSRYSNRVPPLSISQDALVEWKQRVFKFQSQVKVTPPAQQSTLFDVPTPITADPNSVEPFQLRQQNIEFWRWKGTDAGIPAFYFVIDYELPIVLYVGETVKSGQRWKGEHDCKRYIDNYRQVHYPYGLTTKLGIAFWLQAPTATRSRQQLESALIYKWRSPFNKENWVFWGTPFVGGK